MAPEVEPRLVFERWSFVGFMDGEPDDIERSNDFLLRRSDEDIQMRRRNEVSNSTAFELLVDLPYLVVRQGTLPDGRVRTQVYIHDNLLGETPSR